MVTSAEAFVDESVRGQRYLLACVVVEEERLGDVRRAMRRLAVRGRVHFSHESMERRARLLEEICSMPISVVVVHARIGHGVRQSQAREWCLSAMVRWLQGQGVSRVVLESRDDDRDDVRHLMRVRQPTPPLVFRHLRAIDEPILWAADAAAWSFGAGGVWREAVMGLDPEVIEAWP